MIEEDIQLIEPTEKLKEAYLDFAEDFRSSGQLQQIHESGWDFGDDFTAFLQKLRDHAKGKNMPDDWVPASAYWLVQPSRIIGACEIRHRLTDALKDFGGHVGYAIRPSERNKGYGTLILKLSLERARELGINRLLITCAQTNIASVRIIHKNGGVFESQSYSQQAGRVTQRYRIELNKRN